MTTGNALVHLDAELGRHLDRITGEPGAVHAVLFTSDGLVKAISTGLGRDEADRTAAGLSGLQSLSQGLNGFCDTGELRWRRTIVDFGGHTVLLLTAGAHTCLAVSAAAGLAEDAFAIVSRTTLDVVKAMAPHLGAVKRA